MRCVVKMEVEGEVWGGLVGNGGGGGFTHSFTLLYFTLLYLPFFYTFLLYFSTPLCSALLYSTYINQRGRESGLWKISCAFFLNGGDVEWVWMH